MSDPDSILDVVAQRIRSVRALRGISRKILAERANVSVRHLAQIEKGSGNVSIMLLGQIADALGVSPGHLLTTSVTAEHALLSELVATLSAEQCERAESLIRTEFLKNDGREARQICLVGLRGAGKSTLGRFLAEEMGVQFVSITERIETNAGMNVSEINSLSGHVGYRRYELEAVHEVLNGDPAVIEAGGSIVANTQAYAALLANSYVVWIQTSPEEHMNRVVEQGDLRPMEGRRDAMDDLVAILEERTPMYARAHAHLDTSQRPLAVSLRELMVIARVGEEAA